MFHTVEEWLVRLGDHIGPWLYAILGALAFAEAGFFLGFVLPGETALLVGGFLASKGVLNLPIMLVVAVGSAIAGDSMGYEVGRYFGPRLKRSWVGHRIGHVRWEKAEGFLRRHGGKAVFMGRAVALLRALVPGLAGASGMRYRTFLPWNAAGGILWGGGCVVLGYVFAKSLDLVSEYLSWGGIVLFAVVVVGWLGHHFWRQHRDRAEEAADDHEPEPARD